MDIERLRKAVTDKRFILSANPDWRAGRACGLTDDKTEKKANDALAIILDNIEELVVAYLIDRGQSATSEEVAEAIDQVEETRRKAQKELDALIETKSRYDHQIEIGDPWNWKWGESWHPLAVERHKQAIKNANLAITALRQMKPSKWIPVSERLPEGKDASANNKVMVLFDNGFVDIWNYLLLVYHITSGAEFGLANITHWIPLPKPPERRMSDENSLRQMPKS